MTERSTTKGLAMTGLAISMALWPLGLLGMFLLFFGDAHDPKHDPRDAVVPYFFVLLFLAGSAVIGLVTRSWRAHPGVSVGATLMAAPWLLLSGIALVAKIARAFHH